MFLPKPAQRQLGVRTALTELLPTGEPSAAAVAAKLHMSPRSLQRRLDAEAGEDVGIWSSIAIDPATDPSLRWHRAYGPARQVEVLRDVLIRLLEETEDDGTFRFHPRDIAVLTPPHLRHELRIGEEAAPDFQSRHSV